MTTASITYDARLSSPETKGEYRLVGRTRLLELLRYCDDSEPRLYGWRQLESDETAGCSVEMLETILSSTGVEGVLQTTTPQTAVFRLRGLLEGTSSDALMEFLTNKRHRRAFMDDGVRERKARLHVGSTMTIFHTMLKAPLVSADRELITLRYVQNGEQARKFLDNGLQGFIECSVNSERTPCAQEHVRASLLLSGWLLKYCGGSSVEVTHVYSLDLRGWLPQFPTYAQRRACTEFARLRELSARPSTGVVVVVGVEPELLITSAVDTKKVSLREISLDDMTTNSDDDDDQAARLLALTPRSEAAIETHIIAHTQAQETLTDDDDDDDDEAAG